MRTLIVKTGPAFTRNQVLNKFFLITFTLFLFGARPFHAAIITTAGNGNWNSVVPGLPWPGGVIPAATDIVIVDNNDILTVTDARSCAGLTLSVGASINMSTNGVTLTVNGNMEMNNNSFISGNDNTRGIAVTGNLTITGPNKTIQNIVLRVDGTFRNVSGNITFNTGNTAGKYFGNFVNDGTFINNTQNVPFTVGGDFTNNGTFTQGTGRVTFTGATSNVLGGTAATTAFGGGITINKGVAQTNVLDVTSVITMVNGGLILTNGSFKLSSASTIVPFTADPNIPATARLWNNGGTMNSSASFNWTLLGALRVDAGGLTFGTAADNRIAPNSTSASSGMIEVNGGTLTITGRISSGADPWIYTMTGGLARLGTIGNTSAGRDVFNMDNSTGGVFTMSGGTLNIVNKGGSVGENLGYHNTATLGGGFTGGVLQIGNSTTAGGSTIKFESTGPIHNLVVNAPGSIAQAAASGTPLSTSIQITNSVTIVDGTIDISNQNILVGGNWTNQSAVADPLTQGTRSVTFNGSSAQTFANSGPATGGIFYNVIFNNSSGSIPQITLNNNLTAANGLTLTAGKVNLNSNVLTLGLSGAAPGTLLRTADYLYGGTFTRWFNSPIIAIGNVAGLFPMGTSAGDYRPLWIGTSAVLTTTGQISVVHSPSYPATYIAATHNDASWGNTLQGVSNSIWTISASTLALNGSSGIVRYGGTGFGTNTLTDLNASLLSSVVGTHGAATNVNTTYEVNRTALTTAQIQNPWRIGSRNIVQSPLPISLSSFTAKPHDKMVELEWTTETETNNDFFTVERSKDCVEFEVIDVVKGAGNSSSRLYYSSTDENPFYGIDYYRLKQTDFDGGFKYHKIVAVKIDKAPASLAIYPNPSDGHLKMEINGNSESVQFMEVFNSLGQRVYSKNGFESTIDLNGQPNGIYFMNVHLSDQVITQKLAIEN